MQKQSQDNHQEGGENQNNERLKKKKGSRRDCAVAILSLALWFVSVNNTILNFPSSIMSFFIYYALRPSLCLLTLKKIIIKQNKNINKNSEWKDIPGSGVECRRAVERKLLTYAQCLSVLLFVWMWMRMRMDEIVGRHLIRFVNWVPDLARPPGGWLDLSFVMKSPDFCTCKVGRIRIHLLTKLRAR